MKKLTIGRGDDCDIYVSDPKGLVSRKHAILKIDNTGGMQITDVSKNGTFINGVRIPAHVPQKVKRKDVVIFANSSKLDWDDIPDSGKWLRIGLMAAIGLIIVILAVIAAGKFTGSKEQDGEISQPLPAVMNPVPETPSNTDVEAKQEPEQSRMEMTTPKSKPVIHLEEPRSRKKQKAEAKTEPEKPESQQDAASSEAESPKTETKAPGGD